MTYSHYEFAGKDRWCEIYSHFMPVLIGLLYAAPCKRGRCPLCKQEDAFYLSASYQEDGWATCINCLPRGGGGLTVLSLYFKACGWSRSTAQKAVDQFFRLRLA